MKRELVISVLLSLGMAACGSDPVGPASEPVLEGSFGDLESFRGAPELHEAYDWGEQTHLDIRTRGDGWVLMAGLTLAGTLGEGDLAPGSVVEVTDLYSRWDEVPAASMLGCSGPADDEWWIDCSPDDIVVQIGEGQTDESVVVSFEATFPDDCGGVIGGPAEPPPYPGDEPPPSDEPIEPLPAAAPVASGEQVIHGVIEVRLADIADDAGWDDIEPVILEGAASAGDTP